MWSRRKFIRSSAIGSLMIGTSQFPLDAFASGEKNKLVILHTNDVHSRIEPFPMDGSKYAGLGGVARRAALIEKIRAEHEHVLLLDAGDIFQGTPYFNLYHGEIDMKLMSEMKYDAATIGNHDFDAGLQGLYDSLAHANFPLINCNYDFSNTIMNGKTIPYKIFEKGKMKIGVLGVGIEMRGLVPDDLFGETIYLDPIDNANRIAVLLKQEEKCDLVICLSHLGWKYSDQKVSDEILAANSRNIDLIIGGHTHTFFDAPLSYKNLDEEEVIVNQVGWAGIFLGELIYIFDKKTRTKKYFSGTKKIS